MRFGVFCRSIQVPSDEVEFRVPAGESVEPGEYNISAPYKIPSVLARLVVPVPNEPDQALKSGR